MGVLKTAEVRWFGEGALSPAAVDWYIQGEARSDVERLREDTYLLVEETDGLGIKLREGRIEVKQRYGQERAVRFSPVARGHVETWCKWAFPLGNGGGQGTDQIDGGVWVTVQKARIVRTFAVTPDDDIVPLAGSASPDRGCSVELTQITADEQLWWSLAFEAVGEEPALVAILKGVTRYVLEGCDVLPLGAEASYGYPRWLQLAVPRLSSLKM